MCCGMARQAIEGLRRRLKRESKVMAVMRAMPGASMGLDRVALAYGDVPPRMWPVAQRSLLAHVQRIQGLQGNPE